MEHDAASRPALKKLDDLGIANNTIVIYTTDNGAETFTWPDGGTTPVPRREEHQLGGQLSRAGDCALAGPGSPHTARSTASSRRRIGCRR